MVSCYLLLILSVFSLGNVSGLLLAKRKNLTSSLYHTVNFVDTAFEHRSLSLFRNLKACADSRMQIENIIGNKVDLFKQCLELYLSNDIPELYLAPLRYTTSKVLSAYSVQSHAHSNIAEAVQNRYNSYLNARHTFDRMKYNIVQYTKTMTNKLSELDMWSPLSTATIALSQIGSDFVNLKTNIDLYANNYLVKFTDLDTKLTLEESIQTEAYNSILLLIPDYETNVTAILKRLATPKSALVPCPTGHHCLLNGAAIACPAGTFQPTQGMTGETACLQCNIGTYSLSGATNCSFCANGTLFGASSCAS